MYSREIKEELDALSQQVFRSKSRWRKLVEEGEIQMVTEEITRYNPEPKEGVPETSKVTVPSLNYGSNGGKAIKYELKRYTVEEVKTKMLDLKAKVEEYMKQLQKQQELKQAEDKTKEQASQAVQQAVTAVSGSAV